MYYADPEKIRSHRPVPWMQNQQLALPFGEASASVEPDAEPTAPPRSTHQTQHAHEAADVPCPDMLPHEVRETYVSVFGLPALYAVASYPDADRDTPRAEVVA